MWHGHMCDSGMNLVKPGTWTSTLDTKQDQFLMQLYLNVIF